MAGITPDEYRTKWRLPRDYPIVAPGYAAKRSELAKLTGLGSDRRKAAEVSAPDQAPAYVSDPDAQAFDEPAKHRGRPRNSAT